MTEIDKSEINSSVQTTYVLNFLYSDYCNWLLQSIDTVN